MILKSVQISHFRHILDSSKVDIQPDVTCLVGKNESGKTAFLEALRRLKPAQGDVGFEINKHYPAWLVKKHRREGRDIDKTCPVICTFELEENDVKAIEKVFGKGVVISREFSLARRYANTRVYGYNVNQRRAIENIVKSLDLPKEVADAAISAGSFDSIVEAMDEFMSADQEDNRDDEIENACESVKEIVGKLIPEGQTFSGVIMSILWSCVPKFFFYSDYSRLPGKVRIKELLDADPDDLDENHHTALSLLQLADMDEEHLLDPEYETRERELENVANAITLDVLQYWTTNTHLRVKITISQKTETTPNGHQAVHDEMHVRMYDNQHMLSLPFDERSSGFQWFFSFLAAFSSYEQNDDPVIILLDEPALNLHAKAQKDFLRFIEERLSKRCQVIYTTHSPFMIQPGQIGRARLIEDKGLKNGSVATSDVLTTDGDTLFPLQAALGYDLAQHLFISKDNLVVEGPSDYHFMEIISSHLTELGSEGLNSRWAIMPLGGADVIPAFVALLGNHLDVTVVVDARKEGHQKLSALAEDGFLSNKRIITVGEIAGRKIADIEDLFSKKDYLDLYNAALGKSLKVSDLKGADPIVRQIARHEGIDRFNHDAPAKVLLREREKRVAKLSDETLAAFEKLFKRINETLGVD